MNQLDPPAVAFWCFVACGLMAAFAQLAQWLGVPL